MQRFPHPIEITLALLTTPQTQVANVVRLPALDLMIQNDHLIQFGVAPKKVHAFLWCDAVNGLKSHSNSCNANRLTETADMM